MEKTHLCCSPQKNLVHERNEEIWTFSECTPFWFSWMNYFFSTYVTCVTIGLCMKPTTFAYLSEVWSYPMPPSRPPTPSVRVLPSWWCMACLVTRRTFSPLPRHWVNMYQRYSDMKLDKCLLLCKIFKLCHNPVTIDKFLHPIWQTN